MNILMVGYENTAGVLKYLSEAVNQYTEHSARYITETVHTFQYREDLINTGENQHTINRLLNNADIIHWHSGDSRHYLQQNSILKYVLPRVKQVKHFHGTELRRSRDQLMHKDFAMYFVATPDMLDYLARYRNVAFLPNPLNVGAYFPVNQNTDHPIVCHSPTATMTIKHYEDFCPSQKYCKTSNKLYTVKHTDFFKNQIDDITRTYPIEYRQIKMPSAYGCIRAKADCHILLDQLYCGVYGYNAIEGMALGQPVIARIDERLAHHYPDCPIVSVNDDEFKQALINLITDKALRIDIGKKSYDWVRSFHDYKPVVEKYIEHLETIF